MGSYAEAVALTEGTSTSPDIALARRIRVTYGLVANAEQAISRELGLFSRVSWTPGHVEVMGWTDCDQSAAIGASLIGTRWHRPNDTFGIGGAVEGLSAEARSFFGAGGMGIVVGDGRMNYRLEQVMEAYYSLGLDKKTSLTFDYQFVANPAYNADRGPISIYGLRVHAEI
jgi:high affinity Mn2+ porin